MDRGPYFAIAGLAGLARLSCQGASKGCPFATAGEMFRLGTEAFCPSAGSESRCRSRWTADAAAPLRFGLLRGRVAQTDRWKSEHFPCGCEGVLGGRNGGAAPWRPREPTGGAAPRVSRPQWT